jgi:hypothetical protein
MRPKEIGELSEANIVVHLLRLGFVILRPLSEISRYDYVLHIEDRFIRIQCKTGRLRSGSVRFSCSSSGGGRVSDIRRDYKNDADYFVVYCPETDLSYVIKVSDCGKNGISFRINPFKRKFTQFKLARDYELNLESFHAGP